MKSSEAETEIHWIQQSLEDMYKWFQVYKLPGKIETKKLIVLVKSRDSKQGSKHNYSKKVNIGKLRSLTSSTLSTMKR